MDAVNVDEQDASDRRVCSGLALLVIVVPAGASLVARWLGLRFVGELVLL